jgi:hypothetical protein
MQGDGNEGWSVPGLRPGQRITVTVVGYHSAFGVIAGGSLWRWAGAAACVRVPSARRELKVQGHHSL